VIDLHNHLLVGLDDGSQSLARSAAVLTRFRDHGVTAVVCTPHLPAGAMARGAEERIAQRDAALTALRQVAPVGMTLYPGFEIMLDEPLPAHALADRRFALAGSRYLLVEFPTHVAAKVAVSILEAMARVGVVPLVAHPERYAECSVEVVRAWKAAGAAVQVDATTVTRPTPRGLRARALVQAGLADVLAADNHGDLRGLWIGREYVDTRSTRRIAPLPGTQLAVTNPAHVLADRDLETVPPAGLRRSIKERIKGLWH